MLGIARPEVGGQRAAPADEGGDDVRGVTVEGLAGSAGKRQHTRW
jgi:hypothetical protein